MFAGQMLRNNESRVEIASILPAFSPGRFFFHSHRNTPGGRQATFRKDAQRETESGLASVVTEFRTRDGVLRSAQIAFTGETIP